MKLKNISPEEQKVLPNTGPAFSCVPGAEVDVADVCGAELVRDFPSVWEAVAVKPKSKKKES